MRVSTEEFVKNFIVSNKIDIYLKKLTCVTHDLTFLHLLSIAALEGSAQDAASESI